MLVEPGLYFLYFFNNWGSAFGMAHAWHHILLVLSTSTLVILISTSCDCDAAEVSRTRRRLENWKAIPPQVPATRECDQIINVVTLPQIQLAATSLMKLIFPEQIVAIAISSIETLFSYSVQAQVVCASCDEMRLMYSDADSEGAGASFWNKTGRFAFTSYCGTGTFAANVTHSALLLLIPFDPDSGKPVVGVTVISHLSMPSFSFGEQLGAWFQLHHHHHHQQQQQQHFHQVAN
jgi:hypothetical protein